MILSKARRPKYNLLIESNVVKRSAAVELLVLIIDNKLSFEKHIAKLCQAASCKLSAHKKILNIRKRQILQRK